MQRATPTKAGERGSALLIVFLLAAVIAIMLYMEMPVAVFEAQRQKEELLIDRGNEYAHAVKLFVRKLGTYPASMDALEKTNQMRFLRHRFKDPFTGKDDWRVLHAGPNGIIIDSKVKPVGLTGNSTGSNSASTQNGAAGGGLFGSSSNNPNSASSSPFGSSTSSGGFGSNSSTSSDAAGVVVPALPQRAPAVMANGSGQPAAGAADPNNPLAPLLPPGQAETSTATQPGAGQNATPGQQAAGLPGQNATAAGANQAGGIGNTAAPANTNATGTNTGTTGTGSGLGVINTGGIAGVASIAKGHTIKVVNDQTNYSLWEFFYDPTKDATKGIASALGALGGQQGSQQQNGSPFGSGSSSGSSSPFSIGNSSNSNNGTTSTTPAPLNNSTSPGTTSPPVQNPQ